MGTHRIGLMWGISAKDITNPDFLEDHEASMKRSLRVLPYETGGAGVRVVGFWVALYEDSREFDVPCLSTCTLPLQRTASGFVNAKVNWGEFARWCSIRGDILPPPQLWLVAY